MCQHVDHRNGRVHTYRERTVPSHVLVEGLQNAALMLLVLPLNKWRIAAVKPTGARLHDGVRVVVVVDLVEYLFSKQLLNAIKILLVLGDLVGEDAKRIQQGFFLAPVLAFRLFLQLADDDLHVLVQVIGEFLFARLFDIGQVLDQILIGALYVERV